HFATALGVEPSADQLAHAEAAGNVRYVRAAAERLPVAGRSAALITAAQAAHWFDRPAFYAEARRIAVDGAVLALVSYGVLELDAELTPRFDRFYREDIGPYWPPERRWVDTGYADIDFPFAEHPAPRLVIEKDWALAEFLGYLSTWSAVRRAEQAGEQDMLRAFAAELAEAWGDPATTRRGCGPIARRRAVLRSACLRSGEIGRRGVADRSAVRVGSQLVVAVGGPGRPEGGPPAVHPPCRSPSWSTRAVWRTVK